MAVGFISCGLLYLVGRAVPAAAGALDHEDIAGGHLRLCVWPELAALTARAQHIVAPGNAGLAARHAMRPYQAMSREDRGGHRLEKAQSAQRAIAAVPPATPARAVADLEALEAHREAPFEHFGVGEPRVRHVGLHHVGTVESRPRARAAADRLVILVLPIAEGEVVHRALRRGHRQYQYYETVGGGSGAGPGFDGADVVQTHMTNSRLTDPEVLEWRFPVRLESFEIRHGSGGRGQWRGGSGAVRRLPVLEPREAATLSGDL